jgi:hypothetical protein
MSIYSVSGKEVPILARIEWHTFPASVPARVVSRFLQERKQMLREESRHMQTAWNDYLADITAKSTQRMRGMLSQFLSTPLTSDNQEINRILGEQVQYVTDLLMPNTKAGIAEAVSGKISFDVGANASLKKLTSSAKRMYGIGGSKPGKNTAEHFEEMLIFKGSSNLDVLQIIEEQIAERMAGSEPEGHASSGKTLAVQRFSIGEATQTGGRHEAILVLDGHVVGHKSIQALASALASEHPALHVSIWEDVFRPNDISLRMRGLERARLRELVQHLGNVKHFPQAGAAVKKAKGLYFVEVLSEERELA